MFFDFRFYLPKKTIEAKSDRAKVKGEVVPFQIKLDQTALMMIEVGKHFAGTAVHTVTDSWFGNSNLLKPVRKALGQCFNILSRLRCNSGLYDFPEAKKPGQRGRNKKYGKRLGLQRIWQSQFSKIRLNILSIFMVSNVRTFLRQQGDGKNIEMPYSSGLGFSENTMDSHVYNRSVFICDTDSDILIRKNII